MNYFRDIKLMNTRMTEVFKINRDNYILIAELKSIYGIAYAMITRRWNYHFNNTKFQYDHIEDVRNYLFPNISCSYTDISKVIILLQETRNMMMHYHVPIKKEYIISREFQELIIVSIKEKIRCPYRVSFFGNITLYGLTMLLVLCLDEYSERETFIRLLTGGNRNSGAGSIRRDYTNKLPAPPCLKNLVDTKPYKFFERYYAHKLIKASIHSERIILGEVVFDSNNKGYISFLTILNDYNVNCKENLNFLRVIGVHGNLIETEYKNNKIITFESIIRNIQIVIKDFSTNQNLVRYYQDLTEAFLTYKICTFYIKQLSAKRGIKYSFNHQSDIGFANEFQNLLEKNKFLKSAGEIIIFDMFGYNLEMLHPAKDYQRLIFVMTKSKMIKMRKFEIVRYNYDINLFDVYVDKQKNETGVFSVFKSIDWEITIESKNQRNYTTTDITLYDSPYIKMIDRTLEGET